jgi:hypothetical protein
MSLGNATFGGFIVGRASRLPSKDLPTQARRPRYIQKSKSKLLLVLFAGLKELEYRGYDSAGIAVMEEGGVFRSFKSVGKLENLVAKAGCYGTQVKGVRINS